MPDLMTFAALWGFFALLSATAGMAKGHSFAAWLILGALFGVFAFIYIAFAERQARE